ncbi:MAG: hypothetical protein SGI74_10925 [Oligoflexia bacterium]|nr:hypothetical protein [Oligoflexia bacterium]
MTNKVVPIFFIFVCFLSNADAAIPVQQVTAEKREKYMDNGVFVGGHDQGDVALLNIRQSFDKVTGLERLVLDIAHKDGGKLALRPGFFHVAVQGNQRRVVIDLENVIPSKINNPILKQLLSKSKFFSTGTMYYDESNKNLTIEMLLKSKAQVEVFELVSTDKPGRIVVDVKGM